MDLRSGNITTGVKWTGLSSLINALVKLIQVSVLAHLLSPESFGLIAIAYIFLTFGDIIVDMGLTTAILHFQDIRSRQYSTIFWVNIILGLLLSGMIYLTSDAIANYYDNEKVIPVIRLLAINLFILSLSRLHKTYLQKQLKFKKMSLIEIIGAILMCVSAVVMAIAGWGVFSIVFATLFSSLIITILFIVKVPQLNKQIKLYISFIEIKNFYAIGIYQFIASIIEFFSRELDTMFISSYYSTEMLGYYTLCKQFTSRLYNVINPVVIKVAIPALAIIQNDITRIKQTFIKMIQFASCVNFPIYSLIIILAPVILLYLYGPKYLDQTPLLQILAIYYALISIGSFTGILTVALGNTKVGLFWSIYRVVSLSVACFLCKSFPFIQFVFIMTVGITLVNYYVGYRLTIRKFIPLNFNDYIKPQLIPLFITSFSCIATFFIIDIFDWDVVMAGCIGFICFTCIYIALSFVFNRQIIIFLVNHVKR